jgi:hypothetical protein
LFFLIEWLNYYQQPYVLASLNKYVSNVNHEIWNKSGSDTNNAEAAHSMANREGKQLKLLSAILKLVKQGFFFNYKLHLIFIMY